MHMHGSREGASESLDPNPSWKIQFSYIKITLKCHRRPPAIKISHGPPPPLGKLLDSLIFGSAHAYKFGEVKAIKNFCMDVPTPKMKNDYRFEDHLYF